MRDKPKLISQNAMSDWTLIMENISFFCFGVTNEQSLSISKKFINSLRPIKHSTNKIKIITKTIFDFAVE